MVKKSFVVVRYLLDFRSEPEQYPAPHQESRPTRIHITALNSYLRYRFRAPNPIQTLQNTVKAPVQILPKPAQSLPNPAPVATGMFNYPFFLVFFFFLEFDSIRALLNENNRNSVCSKCLITLC